MPKFVSPTRVPAVTPPPTKKGIAAHAALPHPAAHITAPKPGKTPHDQHAHTACSGKQHGR